MRGGKEFKKGGGESGSLDTLCERTNLPLGSFHSCGRAAFGVWGLTSSD